MTTTHISETNEETSLSTEYSFNKNYLNNNEIYEKIRPLERMTKLLNEDQAHGDENQEKSQLTNKRIDISTISLFSNEFAPEMEKRSADTLNSDDDEHGITKPYVTSNYNIDGKDLILSDVSLQQQQIPNGECEYEIDLGNGWITKSMSSYQSDQIKQPRKASILSADLIQPTRTFHIPFSNTFYKQAIQSKTDAPIEQTVLFNSYDSSPQRWSQISLKKVTFVSLGSATVLIVIVIIFLVF